MVWINDIQVASNDRDVLHLTLGEGDVGGGFIGQNWWVIIVANEVEGQTSSGANHHVISDNTNHPA